jgi:hypothetical protein
MYNLQHNFFKNKSEIILMISIRKAGCALVEVNYLHQYYTNRIVVRCTGILYLPGIKGGQRSHGFFR